MRVIIFNGPFGLSDPRWDIFVNGIYRGKMNHYERHLLLKSQAFGLSAKMAEETAPVLVTAVNSGEKDFDVDEIMALMQQYATGQVQGGIAHAKLRANIVSRMDLSDGAQIKVNGGLFGSRVTSVIL